MPVSAFEQTKQGGGAPTVSINIMGLGQATTVVAEDDVTYDISDVEAKDDSILRNLNATSDSIGEEL
jgi:hypothetical protein